MILGSILSAGVGSLVMSEIPAPLCREHGKRIILCLECCIAIHENAGGLHPDMRHEWAVENIYVPMEEW